MNRISTHKTPLYFSIPLSISLLISSVSGLFIKSVYSRETANWAVQGAGQDIMNLLLIPLLLISAYRIKTKVKTSLFLWLGCMFYLLYSFVIYSFAIHFNALFLVYCTNLGLSVYAIITVLFQTDLAEIKSRFDEKKSYLTASAFLICMALLFAMLWLKEIIPALLGGIVPATILESGIPVNPVHVLDLAIFLPAFFVSAFLLYKKHPAGYLFVPSLLMFAAIMAISIGELFIYMKMNHVSDDISPVYVMLILAGTSLYVYRKMIRDVQRGF